MVNFNFFSLLPIQYTFCERNVNVHRGQHTNRYQVFPFPCRRERNLRDVHVEVPRALKNEKCGVHVCVHVCSYDKLLAAVLLREPYSVFRRK